MLKVKLMFGLFIVLFILLLSSCSSLENTIQSSNPPDINGYITKIQNQRALVVSQVPKDTGGVKEHYDAIWVSNIPREVQVGQKVQVWFTGGIDESYPAQGKSRKFAVIKSLKPAKADLSEDQVIRKALTEQETLNVNVFVIKDIEYDQNLDIWTIRFIDGFLVGRNAEDRSVQVFDK